MKAALLIVVAALAILSPLAGLTTGTAPAAAARYFPTSGDHVNYVETITVSNGVGNYQGYTEATFINGSIGVTGIGGAQAVDSTYAYTTSYRNSTGASENYPSSGTFIWSAQTFHYVQGTDNQTGYTDPYVWFYIDNTLANGGTFFLLNSQFSMVSTTAAYPTARSSTGYASALYGFGNSSYQRSDVYGTFLASYTWKAYFDPSTGYILGYTYAEQDRDASGNGFDYTDVLSVTSASYAVTPTAAPSSGSPSSAFTSTLVVVLLALVVVVIIIVILYAVMRSRRRPALPPHSAGGNVAYSYAPPPPAGPPPPALHLTPQDQPAVQQVVVREKVMVNCRYCGALMEPEAANCPKCGAPRS